MEIKINPVSLDDRLKIIQSTSPDQQAVSSKFHWVSVLALLAIGAAITIGIYEYRRESKNKYSVST
jgi:hypothetical protein